MKTLRTLALLAAISAFYLLVAGAHVNTYQAALSVPDWPLSYGHILAPDWPGNVFYEQHHRATAGTTLVLFIAVLVALWRRSDLEAARRMSLWAAGALTVQIVMGGAIVLALNPPWLSAIHTLTAIATVVLIAATGLAVWQTDEDGRVLATDDDGESSAKSLRIRRRARLAIGLIALQVSLGAVTRHPPVGELIFITTLMAHLLVGVLLLIWLVLLALSVIRNPPAPSLRKWGWLLAVAVVAQLMVGGWVFVISPEPFSESWPPPAGFPNAHAAHIVLAAVMATCLAAVWMRARGKER